MVKIKHLGGLHLIAALILPQTVILTNMNALVCLLSQYVGTGVSQVVDRYGF